MRVAFLGTPETAVPFLEALVAGGHDVGLVVTRPDRPRGRSAAPAPPPVKRAAIRLGIEVEQPAATRRPEFAQRLVSVRADLLVVVAYGRILTAEALAAAPRGAVNVHFSLLPRWRGAAPVQWCLAAGDERTGVCTMQLDDGLDTGPILLAEETPIRADEHAPALTARLVALGVPLLLRTLDGLARGDLRPRAQDDASATRAPMITRSDGEVSPALPARAIAGRVRGFDPWPGVWLRRGGTRIRIVRALPRDGETASHAPGTVLRLDEDDLLVACGGGSVLAVRDVQPEGRRTVAVRDAVNGRLLAPGDVLEKL